MSELTCKDCSTTFSGHGSRLYCDSCKAKRYPPPKMKRDDCLMCGADIRKTGRLLYCPPCGFDRATKTKYRKVWVPKTDNEMARLITKYAVKVGFLPHPADFHCVDCKRRPAKCYDHRDYSKPLHVDPVCIPCNASRGRGIPFIAPNSKHAA